MGNDVYIKQADAVFAVQKRIEQIGMENNPYVCSIRQAVRDVPAADVEPKREIVPWKVAGAFDDFYQCTKCGNMWPIFSTVEWAYCPACGCRKFPEPPGEVDDGHMDV